MSLRQKISDFTMPTQVATVLGVRTFHSGLWFALYNDPFMILSVRSDTVVFLSPLANSKGAGKLLLVLN